MLTITDPRGITCLTNQYDSGGRVVLQTQADSSTFAFAYTIDGAGRIVQTDVTTPRGAVRRSVFNTAGYQESFTEAVGTPLARTTTYVRDATSQRVTSITDPLNRQTDFAYDSSGNLTSVTRLAGTGNAVATSWTYEPLFQQVATVTDPLGHTTSFSYDAGGRLTGVTNAFSQQWSVSLTDEGQVAAVTDPLTHSVEYEYAFGDLTTATNGLAHRVRFHTDAAAADLDDGPAGQPDGGCLQTPLNLVPRHAGPGDPARAGPTRRPARHLTSCTTLARLANVITVNMHEAKTRLSELVKAVEERNETVVLCRAGREVAEIRRRTKRRAVRNLTPDPRFRVESAPGYRPTEPLSEEEWPETSR
jgi:YD repeat-containing protein